MEELPSDIQRAVKAPETNHSFNTNMESKNKVNIKCGHSTNYRPNYYTIANAQDKTYNHSILSCKQQPKVNHTFRLNTSPE